MTQLYDVTFYGSDHEGEQLIATKARVAQLLSLPPERVDALFKQKGGVILKTGIPIETAQKYQTALTEAGGNCNCKPSTSKERVLELVEHVDVFQQKRFVCPACGFIKDLNEEEPTPKSCEKCGIFPDKFKRANEAK